MSNSRIIYPEDFIRQKELFTKIKAKHIADGVNTPLKAAWLTDKGIVFTDDETAVANADGFESNRKSLSRQGEDLREKRDLKLDPAFKNVRPMLQFLKSYYRPNVQPVPNALAATAKYLNLLLI